MALSLCVDVCVVCSASAGGAGYTTGGGVVVSPRTSLRRRKTRTWPARGGVASRSNTPSPAHTPATSRLGATRYNRVQPRHPLTHGVAPPWRPLHTTLQTHGTYLQSATTLGLACRSRWLTLIYGGGIGGGDGGGGNSGGGPRRRYTACGSRGGVWQSRWRRRRRRRRRRRHAAAACGGGGRHWRWRGRGS